MSPAAKGGSDVLGDSARTQVSPNGNGVKFASLGVFGPTIGSAVSTEYVARRTGGLGTQGWTTRAITPRLEATSLVDTSVAGLQPRYIGSLAEDLGAGIFLSHTPLTNEDTNVEAVPSLYRESGLGQDGQVATLVSLCPACASPLATAPSSTVQPLFVGASRDLTRVIFESTFNLTADARGSALPSGTGFRKLYKWVDGNLSLAGVLPNGDPATCDASNACSMAGRGGDATSPRFTLTTMSADGSRVFFTTPILASGALTTTSAIYMRDDQGTATPADDTTTQLNRTERTTPDTVQAATFWFASSAGTVVYFTTAEALTDDANVDAQQKLYRYTSRADTFGRHLTLVSVNALNPAVTSGVSGVIGLSDDGSTVYFIASDQIAVSGRIACTASNPCIFRWHDDGAGSPVVQEAAQVTSAEVNDLVGVSPAAPSARVTPDGDHLVFVSEGSPTLPGNNGTACGNEDELGGPDRQVGTCTEVYVYSATAQAGMGEVLCASCPVGAATVDADFNVRTRAVGVAATSTNLTVPISDDGRYVYFTTRERLVDDDRNQQLDAYQFNTTTRVMHLLSSGTSASDSYFMTASPSGRDALFLTRERLTGWDVDGNYDLYDARIGGGVPEPDPERTPCEGEACRAKPSTPPETFSPASESFLGVENLAEAAGAVPAFAVPALTRMQQARWARTGRLRLRVQISEGGRVSARAEARVRGRTRLVARSSSAAAGGGTVILRLKLSEAARHHLVRRGTLRVTVFVGYSHSGVLQRVSARLRARLAGETR